MISGLSCSYLVSSLHIWTWYLEITYGLMGSFPVSGAPFQSQGLLSGLRDYFPVSVAPIWAQWLLYGLNGSLMVSGAPIWSQGLLFGYRRLVSSLGLISNHRGSYLVSKNSFLVSAAHF